MYAKFRIKLFDILFFPHINFKVDDNTKERI